MEYESILDILNQEKKAVESLNGSISRVPLWEETIKEEKDFLKMTGNDTSEIARNFVREYEERISTEKRNISMRKKKLQFFAEKSAI